MKHRKRILLLSSAFMLPFMILVFAVTQMLAEVRLGYLNGFSIYWVCCLTIFLYVRDGRNGYLHDMLRIIRPRGTGWLYMVLAILPIIAVFAVQFIPYFGEIDKGIMGLALVTAMVNGTVEELYWRGLYMNEFMDNTAVGVWLATVLFGNWHIALYSIDEMSFGGFWPLVGGAAFMGLVWSICARRLGSIVPGMLAHIVVNVFAFAGLYAENGF